MLTPLRDTLNPLGASRKRSADYAGLVASLNPYVWLRKRETSGSIAANAGSGGSGADGAIVDTTLGQTGALGANEAFLFDGLTSIVTVPDSAGLRAAVTTFTIAQLVYPTSVGENNAGRFFEYEARVNAFFISAARTLRLNVFSADTRTTTTMPLNAWRWVFFTYDDAGDRLGRIYIGASGAATECVYSTQTAGSGVQTPTSGFVVGNRPLIDRTWAGLFDETLIIPSVLSSAQMSQIVALTGI